MYSLVPFVTKDVLRTQQTTLVNEFISTTRFTITPKQWRRRVRQPLVFVVSEVIEVKQDRKDGIDAQWLPSSSPDTVRREKAVRSVVGSRATAEVPYQTTTERRTLVRLVLVSDDPRWHWSAFHIISFRFAPLSPVLTGIVGRRTLLVVFSRPSTARTPEEEREGPPPVRPRRRVTSEDDGRRHTEKGGRPVLVHLVFEAGISRDGTAYNVTTPR